VINRLFAVVGFATLLIVSASEPALAQAVEIFAGDDAATADVMFFNYFKDTAGQPSRLLLFHRSRALVDHDINESARTNLPQFGMTNAVSFNPATWRGLAPVAAVSLTTGGVASKVGIQYARVRPASTVFGWVVSETAARPAIDIFMLGRYVHRLTSTAGLFTQIESIVVLPTATDEDAVMTLRSRLGIDRARWQLGIGVDLRRSTGVGSTTTANLGLFARHSF